MHLLSGGREEQVPVGQKTTNKRCLASEGILFNAYKIPMLVTALLVESRTFINQFSLLCSFYDTGNAEVRFSNGINIADNSSHSCKTMVPQLQKKQKIPSVTSKLSIIFL